jgi:hypothetical protein
MGGTFPYLVMFYPILRDFNRPHRTSIPSPQSAPTTSSSQLRRYASSPAMLCCIYRLASKPIPGLGNHLVHQSMISMTIRFSMSFMFFDRTYATWMNLEAHCGICLASAGGTSWRKFAKGGGTSSSGRPLTCVSPSFVQLARPWPRCWHIRLPFLSLSTMMKVFNTSPQKTKRE